MAESRYRIKPGVWGMVFGYTWFAATAPLAWWMHWRLGVAWILCALVMALAGIAMATLDHCVARWLNG